jgi:hypothetical protein
VELQTRKEAISQGNKHFFTGRPCHRGHIAKRYVIGGHCFQCNSEAPVHKNHNLYVKRWKNQNVEKVKLDIVAYQSRPEVKAQRAKRQKAREAQKRNAEYRWNPELHDLVMEEAYLLAQLRKIATGVVHHVDHIVPLQGRMVCGLHVWNNVRVIPMLDNISKGNKLQEDLL